MDNEEKNQACANKDNICENKMKEKESLGEIKRREKIDGIKEEIGEIEDTTKYGEFVSSYFAWLTLDRQKKTAKKLENITKKDKENDK